MHSIVLSVLMSFIAWTLVNYFIIAITFIEFVIIEILIGIGELFSIFVKKKFGLLNPKDIQYLDDNQQEPEDGLQ